MIKNIERIIEEILKENGESLNTVLTNDTELINLGLSSFDLATLTVRIEDEYDIDIFEDGIVRTVGEIVNILEK